MKIKLFQAMAELTWGKGGHRPPQFLFLFILHYIYIYIYIYILFIFKFF